jgi:hypothetical protein
MNTRFDYLYRDASNYKQWGSIVFAGSLTPAMLERLTRSLESSEFFIADQVRVPEVFHDTWPSYDDDHCWHEWAGFELTDCDADDRFGRTIEQFVGEVEAASVAGWRDFVPQEREAQFR